MQPKRTSALIGRLHWVAAEIARSEGLTKGYRTVINTGDDGGQTVDHIHVHLLGGRSLWRGRRGKAGNREYNGSLG